MFELTFHWIVVFVRQDVISDRVSRPVNSMVEEIPRYIDLFHDEADDVSGSEM